LRYFSKDVVPALTDVNLVLRQGECLGVIGESGSGKTTLARCLLRLIDIDGGSILYRGKNLNQLSQNKMRQIRPDMQIIFQDPGQSLNPRHTIYSCLSEAVNVRRKLLRHETHEKITRLLDQVNLSESILSSLPAQLSGGQKQRVAIARALASDPKLIIADEPTSSLDAPFKKDILDLLFKLKEERELTLILITHDLRVTAQMTDRLIFLYKGRIVESGNTPDVIKKPLHPYTKLLFSVARFQQNQNHTGWNVDLSSENDTDRFMKRCSYYPECPIRESRCLTTVPVLTKIEINGYVACHRVEKGNRPIIEN
jgi:oligopeptide/dipeptide ABC transporter ATP-binding protein